MGSIEGADATPPTTAITNLVIGNEHDALFKTEINVTATNNQSDGGAVAATGILGISQVDIKSQLDGKVTAKATSKSSYAQAAGIAANQLNITKAIAKDVSATATGYGAQAIGVGAINTDPAQSPEVYSGYLTTADIDAKITASATANGDGTAASVNSEATAAALFAQVNNDTADTLTTGNINKDLTATASAKTGVATAAGIANISRDMTKRGDVTTDDINGAIKATATSKTTAMAMGIVGGEVTVGDVNKGITASASGNSGNAEARSIDGSTKATVGNVNAAIKATATSKATATAKGITGGEVTVGDINKDITASASGKSGEAGAMGIESTSLATVRDVNAAIKATATSQLRAKAKGITGIEVTVGDVNKNITASASGNEGSAEAMGINGDTKLTVMDVNAAIKATATTTMTATAKGITGGEVAVDDINKDITASASGNGGNVSAMGIEGTTSATVGDVNAAIKATATTKEVSADASGFVGQSIHVESFNKDVTVSATGGLSAQATGVYSKGGDSSVGTVNGKITATATANGDSDKQGGSFEKGHVAAEAIGILSLKGSEDTFKLGAINGAITATANDKATTAAKWPEATTDVKSAEHEPATLGAAAVGIDSEAGLATQGINAAIKASATSKAGEANAVGVRAIKNLELDGAIKKDITATANGKTANAGGIISQQGEVSVGEIKGKIAASATATEGEARVGALGGYGAGEIKINNGGITKEISATANSKKKGDAVAAAIFNWNDKEGSEAKIGNVSIDDSVKGKLTASATSKEGVARAYGVVANTLNVTDTLGTVNATASGKSDGEAVGWKATKIEGDGYVSGKATVTNKTGDAIGMSVGTIVNHSGVSGTTASLDITATGKKAVGVQFTGATNVILEESKITAKAADKASTTYAMQDAASDTQIQNIQLKYSTVTGDIDLGKGNDILDVWDTTVTGDITMGDGNDRLDICHGSKVTGNINLDADETLSGNGDAGDQGTGEEMPVYENASETDVVRIHSGSVVKGNITGAEDTWFVVEDAANVKNAMWDGDLGGSDLGTLKLDISSAIGEGAPLVTLAKSKTEWGEATAVELYLDGTRVKDKDGNDVTLTLGAATDLSDAYAFNYELQKDKSGKTLQVAIALNKEA